nr:integrase [bacterium]
MANSWEADLWKEYNPLAEPKPVYPFETLITGFIKDKDPKTSDMVRIERLLEFFSPEENMGELDGNRVNDYIRYRRSCTHYGKPISDPSIRRELTVLSSAINHACFNWGWDIDNPVARRKPKDSEPRVRWLTVEEAQRLIEAARSGRSKGLVDFIELSLATGLRKQETLGLEWSRIDFRRGFILLNPTDQKNQRHSTVPLNGSARKVLMRRRDFVQQNCPSSPWVFPNLKEDEAGSVRWNDPKHSFQRALRIAGISNFTIHDMRHTFASWLVQDGVELYIVKELLRHSSITQTERYAHLAPSNAASAVTRLDERLKDPARFQSRLNLEQREVLELVGEKLENSRA